MSKVRTVVATMKEIATVDKMKLVFFITVARGDINKEKILLVLTTGLKNIVKEMSSFLSIIAILIQVA